MYLTLLAQLSLTTAVCALCMYVEAVRSYVLANAALFYLGLILSLAMLIVLWCVKHRFPLNLICLALWTAVEAYTIGVICGMYVALGYEEAVMQAFGLTLALFVALTIFTMQSKWDFGFLRVALFACLLILIVWGLVNLIFGFRAIWLYSLFGAIVFCLFIIFDTWLLIRRGAHFEEGDWILASINLYLDVVNLFLFLLELLTARRR